MCYTHHMHYTAKMMPAAIYPDLPTNNSFVKLDLTLILNKQYNNYKNNINMFLS